MITPVFKATVEGGKLIVQGTSFDKYLKSLNGKEVSVIVKKYKKPKDIRSDKQNKYYWGVVVEIIAEEIGEYNKDEMHEALKYEFLLDRSNKLPLVRSTASLDTEQMEVYLSYIRQWASSKWNIYIPLPNETEYEY